jgi:hypothetical protein
MTVETQIPDIKGRFVKPSLDVAAKGGVTVPSMCIKEIVIVLVTSLGNAELSCPMRWS